MENPNTDLLFSLYLFGRKVRIGVNHPHTDQIVTATVLWLINTGPLSLSGIAKALSVQPSTISEHLDKLKKSGFVFGRINPHDRRAIIFSITPAGKIQLNSITHTMSAKCAVILKNLNQEEQLIATTLLKKLIHE